MKYPFTKTVHLKEGQVLTQKVTSQGRSYTVKTWINSELMYENEDLQKREIENVLSAHYELVSDLLEQDALINK